MLNEKSNFSSKVPSYGKIYNLGHKLLDGLFDDEVFLEEKIDGSMFAFMKKDNELYCRSKGKQLIIDAPEKLFTKAVETAKELFPLLNDGWVYYSEFLSKKDHNSLCYSRPPDKNFILFDVDKGIQNFLLYDEKKQEANRLGLEVVPLLYRGKITKTEELFDLLERTSILGGQKIEGFVVKNYNKFNLDGKIMRGKHVSEAFKEVHRKEWKKTSPNKGDVLQQICDELTTPARWNKSIIHAKEEGKLTQTPKDIGMLIKDIQKDVIEEEKDYILEKLWKWVEPQIRRSVTRGFPDFYKNELMKKQFENKE